MHDQALAILEPGAAVQHRDGRIRLQNFLVLGMAQFFDTCLLLRMQSLAIDNWCARSDAAIKRTLAPQVGDMGRADHDLGRDAANVDAGAAERAALDERDARALFGRFEGRGHRTPAAANDSDMQLACLADCLVAAPEQAQCLVQQALALRRGRGIGQRRTVAERGYRGLERGQGCVAGHGKPRNASGVRHACRAHTGHLLQHLFDMRGARFASHAGNFQLSHGFPF